MATGEGRIIYYSQPNVYGTYFKCSKRTAAHLDHTKSELKKRGKSLKIIQGCFNTGVDASAGTHDGDAVLDVEIFGMDWYQAQKFLRSLGWAAWVRTPAQGFSYHIHMVSLPDYKYKFVAKVGQYVPGQVTSYYNHTSGLIGEAPDITWHPDVIRSTIFDYDKYMASLKLTTKISNTTKRILELRRLRESLRRQRARLNR